MMIFLKFCKAMKGKVKKMKDVMKSFFCAESSYMEKCDDISRIFRENLLKQREKCLGKLYILIRQQ